jgi:transposase
MKESKYSTYDIRVRATRAVKDGMTVVDAAKAYQVHPATLYRWLQRHRDQDGNQGLIRKPGSGRPRKMDEQFNQEFISIASKKASEFGFETDLWTCRRIQTVLNQEYHIQVSLCTVWRRLREVGLTYQKPERSYLEASETSRQIWMDEEWPRIRETVNKYNAILYFEDESNISLTPVLGKTWAPRGKTPIQKGTGARGSISAISAIASQGNLLFSLHEGRIASDEIIHFLDEMLKHHKRRHLVVVMDQARPHVSKKTKAFIEKQDRLHVFYLPPYSPDWNPDEKVWNHLKNHELAGHQAKTKEELMQVTKDKLEKMKKNPHKLKGIFFRCCIADLMK